MRRIFCSLMLLMMSVLMLEAQDYQKLEDGNLKGRIYTLSNGLKVCMKHDPGNSDAEVCLIVHNGDAQQLQGHEELTRFLVRQVRKLSASGTPSRSDVLGLSPGKVKTYKDTLSLSIWDSRAQSPDPVHLTIDLLCYGKSVQLIDLEHWLNDSKYWLKDESLRRQFSNSSSTQTPKIVAVCVSCDVNRNSERVVNTISRCLVRGNLRTEKNSQEKLREEVNRLNAVLNNIGNGNMVAAGGSKTAAKSSDRVSAGKTTVTSGHTVAQVGAGKPAATASNKTDINKVKTSVQQSAAQQPAKPDASKPLMVKLTDQTMIVKPEVTDGVEADLVPDENEQMAVDPSAQMEETSNAETAPAAPTAQLEDDFDADYELEDDSKSPFTHSVWFYLLIILLLLLLLVGILAILRRINLVHSKASMNQQMAKYRTDLLISLARELREPIASVRSTLERISAKGEDKLSSAELENLRKSGGQLLQMIDTLAEYQAQEGEGGLKEKVDVLDMTIIPAEDVHVLLIEPDMKLAAHVSSVLEEYMHVTILGKGQNALAEARRLAPDVVIIDTSMLDNEAYGIMQDLHNQLNLRVILLSDFGSKQNLLRAMQSDADEFVVKPFDSENLAALILKRVKEWRKLPAFTPIEEEALPVTPEALELPEPTTPVLPEAPEPAPAPEPAEPATVLPEVPEPTPILPEDPAPLVLPEEPEPTIPVLPEAPEELPIPEEHIDFVPSSPTPPSDSSEGPLPTLEAPTPEPEPSIPVLPEPSTPEPAEPTPEPEPPTPEPAEPTPAPASKPLKRSDLLFMERLDACMAKNLPNPDFDVNSLAAAMDLSRSQLGKKVKQLYGLSSVELLRNTRLKRAGQMIRDEHVAVQDAMVKVGMSDPANFHRRFKELFGMTPKSYRDVMEP